MQHYLHGGRIPIGSGDAKRNFFNDEDQDGFSWDDTEKN